MSDEKKPYTEADHVLGITVYKLNPQCTEYAFEVKSEFPNNDPRHLEQLIVIHQVLDNYIDQAEKALINSSLLASRKIRRAEAEYMESGLVKDEVTN